MVRKSLLEGLFLESSWLIVRGNGQLGVLFSTIVTLTLWLINRSQEGAVIRYFILCLMREFYLVSEWICFACVLKSEADIAVYTLGWKLYSFQDIWAMRVLCQRHM